MTQHKKLHMLLNKTLHATQCEKLLTTQAKTTAHNTS